MEKIFFFFFFLSFILLGDPCVLRGANPSGRVHDATFLSLKRENKKIHELTTAINNKNAAPKYRHYDTQRVWKENSPCTCISHRRR
jgi:hypothetical protein